MRLTTAGFAISIVAGTTSALAQQSALICRGERGRESGTETWQESNAIHYFLIEPDDEGKISELDWFFCSDGVEDFSVEPIWYKFRCRAEDDSLYSPWKSAQFNIDRFTGEYSAYFDYPGDLLVTEEGKCQLQEQIY